MNAAEINEECRYRYDERLGILCGPLKPTASQVAMAQADARAFRAQNEPEAIAPVNAAQIDLLTT